MMKQILCVLSLSLFMTSAIANNNSETGIEIYSTVENNTLSIEVDKQLSDKTVTVAIFNSVGEIVLEGTLDLGMNKLDVAKLTDGEYVAVVRENEVYKSKEYFQVM